MIEPHIFCGPEFILDVPADHPQPLQPHELLQLQTELYNLLTPTVRRKLQTYGGANNDNALPAASDCLLFISIDVTSQLNIGSGEEGFVQCALLITDSRVAAELYMIGLRNPFIALPQSMRLRNYYATSAGKARATPAEILRKKEGLRARMNFDEDLWNTLQEALTPEWLQEFEQQHNLRGDGTLQMRETERHEKRVESLLHYCEQNVQYVGVLDEEGKASPFLLAMGLFYHLGLTYRDALVHFVRHPRRTVRALALFIARYTTAPEELEPFFAPSLGDEVVIACVYDASATSSMRQLAEDLLLRDEVCEAWPPMYHSYWIEQKVRSMMCRVEAGRKRREELRQLRAHDADACNDDDHVSTKKMKKESDGGGGVASADLKGEGNGVGIFGFRKMTELQAYVRERERVLVPQRILMIPVKRKRGGDGYTDHYNVGGDDNGEEDYYDDDNDEDDDDDGFTIKVQVDGGMGKESYSRQLEERHKEQKKEKKIDVTQKKRRKRDEAITTNTRALVITGAYRTLLSLLGRTEPFDRRGEHYIKF